MPTGYYQKKTKKSFKERVAKGIKIFLKKKQKKTRIVFISDMRIFLKMKNRS